MLLMYLVAVIPAIFNFSLDNIVSFILVPTMIINVVCICLGFKLPKQYPNEWAACGLHCPYWLYCALLTLSIFASVITAVFSLLALDTVGLVGNLLIVVFLFVFSWWRIKSGKVEMRSIAAFKKESGT